MVDDTVRIEGTADGRAYLGRPGNLPFRMASRNVFPRALVARLDPAAGPTAALIDHAIPADLMLTVAQR